MKFPLAITLLLLLLSCQQQEKKETPDVGKQEEDLSPIPKQQKTYRGLFVVGKNMHSFRNCQDPDNNFWVDDTTGRMDELYHTMSENSPVFPYEYVYVEVKASASEAPSEIAAKGFDSILTVKEILTFEQKNYLNTCIPYDFWAIGAGSGWSLQVSEKEGIIALKDYTAGRVYLFEYFSPKVVNDEVFTYHSNNYANQTAISAVFKKTPCADNVSGNEYSFSAYVIINGKRYSGCAIRGSKQQ